MSRAFDPILQASKSVVCSFRVVMCSLCGVSATWWQKLVVDHRESVPVSCLCLAMGFLWQSRWLRLCHVGSNFKLWSIECFCLILLFAVYIFVLTHCLFVYFQQSCTPKADGQEELNDIQIIRLPHLGTAGSRSSLNAISSANTKSNNTTTVTTAIVTMPTSSHNSELESLVASNGSNSPQNRSVVKISTLWPANSVHTHSYSRVNKGKGLGFRGNCSLHRTVWD